LHWLNYCSIESRHNYEKYLLFKTLIYKNIALHNGLKMNSDDSVIPLQK